MTSNHINYDKFEGLSFTVYKTRDMRTDEPAAQAVELYPGEREERIINIQNRIRQDMAGLQHD